MGVDGPCGEHLWESIKNGPKACQYVCLPLHSRRKLPLQEVPTPRKEHAARPLHTVRSLDGVRPAVAAARYFNLIVLRRHNVHVPVTNESTVRR